MKYETKFVIAIGIIVLFFGIGMTWSIHHQNKVEECGKRIAIPLCQERGETYQTTQSNGLSLRYFTCLDQYRRPIEYLYNNEEIKICK